MSTTINRKKPIVEESNPEDPSRKSTWSQTAWVTGGCATLVFSVAKTIDTTTWLRLRLSPCLSALAGYILADLGSGIYHWAIDNYGSPTTPVFGTQISGFQNHHKRPYLITKTPLANNLRELAQGVIFTALPITLACNDPTILAFVSVFAGSVMFSQQFHAWSHETKSKLPRAVVALQEVGVLLSRTEHGRHHRPPFDSNYCIVSGVWNKLLDKFKMFEKMEMVVFFMTGVRPRSSWTTQSDVEWIEKDDVVGVANVSTVDDQ